MGGKRRSLFRPRGINRAAHGFACEVAMEEVIFRVKAVVDGTYQFPAQEPQMHLSRGFFARNRRIVSVWTIGE